MSSKKRGWSRIARIESGYPLSRKLKFAKAIHFSILGNPNPLNMKGSDNRGRAL